jgi:hypothetical protein
MPYFHLLNLSKIGLWNKCIDKIRKLGYDYSQGGKMTAQQYNIKFG